MRGTAEWRVWRGRRCRTLALLVVPLLATTVLVGPAAAASKPSASKTVIKYGTENYVINTPELADALGYLPNIQLEPVTTGLSIPPAEFIESVLKGQVTYGFSNFGTLITANAEGEKVKAVIAFNGNVGAAAGGIYVMDKGSITSAKDLIGQKVAVVPSTLSALIFDQYLQENDIPLSKVQEVSVTYAGGEGEQEVRSGELAAWDTSGSDQAAAVARGGIRRLVSTAKVLGTIELDAYFFSDAFISAHEAAVREFVAGTAKAVVWSQTHTPKEVLAVYDKYLDAHGQGSEASALASWTTNGELKGGVISSRSFTDNEKYLKQIDQLTPGKVTASEVYTNQFNPYAGS